MFSQGKDEKESKTKQNENKKSQTNQGNQEKQKLEQQKFNNKFKYQFETLMQIGMNGVDFESMYNQNINSAMSEIIGEVCVNEIQK
ncbi:unnamed protein product (macronuclear) [Paramecium tetraurelia]|uniref:Uncharacterized protein n=1 Tax=Paramecium tetraurelia TaxID=5888 RepID=A0ED72_PARTE|nr:uncharacterized protein GSPATT00004108001 [Paramecium tetraurelia]CAK93239.1 unnamed protein product [Paramecium tetraurelia]|eukprot:XP_001460636.1 hypothetical protein (macronuclear) [Paramecium tetraurelia strain d4-2]